VSTSAITVTGTATQLVAVNPRRIGLIIDNTSDVPIRFGDADTVTSARGVLLKNGEKYVDYISSVYRYMYRGAYYGACAVSAVIDVTEFTESP